MAATISIPTKFTAQDNFTRVVKQMGSGIKKWSNNSVAAIQRLDTKISKTFSKMSNISKLAIGLGVGALFTSAIQNNLAYNESLNSVSAITGATGSELVKLENKILSVAKSSKKSGPEVAKAFELVGSAKPELLKNVEALGATTEAVITLAKASKLDLETSSSSLTGVMNQFNLGAKESQRTINALAAGAKEGAASIPLVTESILQFGTGAKGFNVTMEESVALVETFAGKGLKGAESGTKLRNILTKMSAVKALPKMALDQLEKFGVNTDIVSDKTIPLNKRLKELAKISGDSTALVKVFGVENKEAGSILLNNISTFENLTTAVTGTNEANRQAIVNSSSLKTKITEVKNAFLNATTATNSNSQKLNILGGAMDFLANNMNTILNISIPILLFFVALKTALFLATTASTAFGVSIAAALWPILAVIAAITLVVAIIMNWGAITEWFSKKFTQATAWIGQKWQDVVTAFKSFNFLSFFASIGNHIKSFLLAPLTGMLTLLSKLPGKVGSLASSGLDFVNQDLFTAPEALDSPEVSNSKSVREEIRESRINGGISLSLNDPGKQVSDVETDGNIPINLSSTQFAL